MGVVIGVHHVYPYSFPLHGFYGDGGPVWVEQPPQWCYIVEATDGTWRKDYVQTGQARPSIGDRL
jgi:hypothetical protein